MKNFIAQYRNQIPPLVSEEQFEEEMTSIVEPSLEACRTIGRLDTFAPRYLSYEEYECENPEGIVVISHGFTESAEKFREMTWYFLQAGYKVFAADHCGHGHSYRYVEDVNICHIEKFEDYVEDLHCLVKKIIEKNPDLPLYFYAHSMGGGIAARYIQKYPDDFDKAILTAPMIAPNAGNIPRWVGKLLADIAVFFGMKKKRVFVHKPFNPNMSFESSPDTSYPRFTYYLKKCVANSHLQNSAASYNWVRESISLTKVLLNKENCKRVKTKVLLFQAEKDDLVTGPEQEKFVEQIANGRLIKISGAKHEIYNSPNDVMSNYLNYIFAFLKENETDIN
ncbi:MAG: alpha/beta fold hydrolase [Lachnospiraceae bacterium]